MHLNSSSGARVIICPIVATYSWGRFGELASVYDVFSVLEIYASFCLVLLLISAYQEGYTFSHALCSFHAWLSLSASFCLYSPSMCAASLKMNLYSVAFLTLCQY